MTAANATPGEPTVHSPGVAVAGESPVEKERQRQQPSALDV